MKKLLPLIVLPFFIILSHSKSALGQACPNGDFENWSITPYSTPDSTWYTSNPQTLLVADSVSVWPVTGYSGLAIHIRTIADTLPGYITNSFGNPENGIGGVPYTQQPTTISGYYSYNMVSGDSATIFVLFKKAGIAISTNLYKISNTSGSLPAFTAFSLPLAAMSEAPDSVIFAAASSNVFGSGAQAGSWLQLDQVEFSTSQPLPGGSFNAWLPDSLYGPTGWNTEIAGNGGTGIIRSTNHYSGDYSVELVSQPNAGGSQPVSPAGLSTGTINNGTATGGLPYTHTVDTLSGWYEYIPAGIDTGMVGVNLYASGVNIGGGNYEFTDHATWTYFSLPFTETTTPDTLRIDISNSSYNSATTPGSILYLDRMQLSSQPLPPLGINSLSSGINSITAYPNPANDVLNIRFKYPTSGPVSAKIYDMTGRALDNQNSNTPADVITFQVGYLPTGLYFYEVVNNGNITRNKFVKE